MPRFRMLDLVMDLFLATFILLGAAWSRRETWTFYKGD
jgi:hypothetical protein